MNTQFGQQPSHSFCRNIQLVYLHMLHIRHVRMLAIKVRKSLAMRQITLEDGADLCSLAVLEYPDGAVLGEEEVDLFQRFARRFLVSSVGTSQEGKGRKGRSSRGRRGRRGWPCSSRGS